MCATKQDDSDVHSINSVMSFSEDGIRTLISSDFGMPSNTYYVPSVPCPGKTYKIHLRHSEKVITITEGEVVLQPPAEAQPGGGWYWVCVEKGNWLGFRNHVSGHFLGRNGKSGLHAKDPHHKTHGFFCVRPHPHGGCVLLVKCPKELRKIGYASDGMTVVEKENDCGEAHQLYCLEQVLTKELKTCS